MSSLSVVVLCSGRGSNLQALIDAHAQGSLAIDIRAVVSDQPECHALERARDAGIPSFALRARDFSERADFDRALFATIAQFDPQLLVCAGYMRIIDAGVVQQWHGRMINIHPSLLPKYAGLHTHRRAIQGGDVEHGATTHFVTAELDGGPRIAQVRLPIGADDTPATLAAKLLPLEHRLLIASVKSIACDELALVDNRVVYRGAPLNMPLACTTDQLRPTLEATPQS